MSWSISLTGKPKNIIAALDKFSASLSGLSKEEFDEVLPGFRTILGSIVQEPQAAADPNSMFRFSASGHACMSNGVKTSSNCIVSIEHAYVRLC